MEAILIKILIVFFKELLFFVLCLLTWTVFGFFCFYIEDTPRACWSASSNDCAYVVLRDGQRIECHEFDFMNEKYERAWVK